MASITRPHRPERAVLVAPVLVAPVLVAALVLPGCAVVNVAGAAVSVAGAAAGAAVSVGGAVVGSTVKVAGKAVEKTIDLVTRAAPPWRPPNEPFLDDDPHPFHRRRKRRRRQIADGTRAGPVPDRQDLPLSRLPTPTARSALMRFYPAYVAGGDRQGRRSLDAIVEAAVDQRRAGAS
jgi:hypothetical protein